jgi:diguanylate cyclase (GGDEF)-like protein
MNRPSDRTGGGILSKWRRSHDDGDHDDRGARPTPARIGDELIGDPKREALHDELEAAVLTSKQTSDVAVLTFVELGELRDVNDTYGPAVGDQLLGLVAERLQSIDVPDTSMMRYEGAVFAAIFPSVPNLSGAEEVAKFLIELLSEPYEIGSNRLTVGAFVGGAVSTDNYDSLDDMIRDAHQSLVTARESGVGAWVVHDESKRPRYGARIDDRRLRDALENEEFCLHYQPIMHLVTGELVAVEALLRWLQPSATNQGMIFPSDFLPLLEKTGLIVEVGEWVLNEACRQLVEWNSSIEQPPTFVGCNIGARQLADPGFGETVVRVLERTGLAPEGLCLDLTEGALRYNHFQRETVWSRLRDLKDMGVRLGIDDFGTGMASLSHLREFRLDVLRLHRMFVAGLGVNREDEAIIRHVTALAHDLGCVTVAEGVENEEHRPQLRDLGVDMAQGFLFGRSMPPEQISAMFGTEPDQDSSSRDPGEVLPDSTA